MHDALHACQLDDQCQNQVQSACNHNTAAGIGKLFSHGHICKYTCIQIRNRRKSTQKSKGRTKESRHLKLRAGMEEQCTKSCTHQGYLDRKSLPLKIGVDQNRHQNGRTEHGEHMLQSQKQHLRQT